MRTEVTELGRILSYTPHHTSRPDILPLDVPDRGLTPTALLTTYNAAALARDGFTGKGTTIVFFAFDGFEQADLDTFATTYRLPKFTPTVVGGQPGEGEVEVAGVVDGDHRSAVVRHVLRPGDGELHGRPGHA